MREKGSLAKAAHTETCAAALFGRAFGFGESQELGFALAIRPYVPAT